MEHLWDQWVEQALERLEALKLTKAIRPISLPMNKKKNFGDFNDGASDSHELDIFNSLQPSDRSSVEVEIDEQTYQEWLGVSHDHRDLINGKYRKLLSFSGNDYLGLTSHPAVRKAAAKAALEHGMGPRGSTIICGYTNYHRQLESSLANLYKKEECVICPTGFAANEAVMVAIGSMSSLLAMGKRPIKEERVAFFSDALNHASIIDGIRLAERNQEAQIFPYRHSDMAHLDALLSACPMKKKVVVTDSLFSMEGDFAPMLEIVKLRKKHGFLWIIDEAHATLACGENGGGVPEIFKCENEVDLCVGMLSKSIGCQGGFIACSKKWKEFINSRGRSCMYSTAIPVPVAAAANAAIAVANKEKWRREAIWSRVREFSALAHMSVSSSYIVSFVVGNEEMAVSASRHMLKNGFHVIQIRPPAVPAHLCRLRISLNATHTFDDMKKLTAALSEFKRLTHGNGNSTRVTTSKL